MKSLQLFTYSFGLIIACVQIGFGIWEAITASANNPHTVHENPIYDI